MGDERTKALGAVQTIGLVALVVAMDAMVKTAAVDLREVHDAG